MITLEEIKDFVETSSARDQQALLRGIVELGFTDLQPGMHRQCMFSVSDMDFFTEILENSMLDPNHGNMRMLEYLLPRLPLYYGLSSTRALGFMVTAFCVEYTYEFGEPPTLTGLINMSTHTQSLSLTDYLSHANKKAPAPEPTSIESSADHTGLFQGETSNVSSLVFGKAVLCNIMLRMLSTYEWLLSDTNRLVDPHSAAGRRYTAWRSPESNPEQIRIENLQVYKIGLTAGADITLADAELLIRDIKTNLISLIEILGTASNLPEIYAEILGFYAYVRSWMYEGGIGLSLATGDIDVLVRLLTTDMNWKGAWDNLYVIFVQQISESIVYVFPNFYNGSKVSSREFVRKLSKSLDSSLSGGTLQQTAVKLSGDIVTFVDSALSSCTSNDPHLSQRNKAGLATELLCLFQLLVLLPVNEDSTVLQFVNATLGKIRNMYGEVAGTNNLGR